MKPSRGIDGFVVGVERCCRNWELRFVVAKSYFDKFDGCVCGPKRIFESSALHARLQSAF